MTIFWCWSGLRCGYRNFKRNFYYSGIGVMWILLVTQEVVEEFLWLFEGWNWNVSLSANRSILVLIRITTRSRNFKGNFIARQHAMHTERDTVMTNPSVRLSVQSCYCVYKWMHISSHFSTIWWKPRYSFFEPHRRYNIPRGSPSAETLNTREGGKILQLSLFISETVRDRPIVTVEH